MGNWSIYGILLSVGVFFGLVTFIMSQIQVTNPLTGMDTSLISWLWSILF